MYDSPEAAKQMIVTGWISRDGRFFGDNEHSARYAGCTHQECRTKGCGNIVPIRSYMECEECRRKKMMQTYKALPFKEWNGEDVICLFDADEDGYFFSQEDLLMYCENNEVDPENLMLVICQPNYPHQLSGDYWSDCFAGDQSEEDVFSKELLEKIKELNHIIEKHPAVSYSPGKFRTEYKISDEERAELNLPPKPWIDNVQ